MRQKRYTQFLMAAEEKDTKYSVLLGQDRQTQNPNPDSYRTLYFTSSSDPLSQLLGHFLRGGGKNAWEKWLLYMYLWTCSGFLCRAQIRQKDKWSDNILTQSLFRPRVIRKRGYPEASVRIALISDPGEDPVPPAKASGHRVLARESPAPVMKRKHCCAAVYWHSLRKRTMGLTRLLSAGGSQPPVRLPSAVCVPSMHPGSYPTGSQRRTIMRPRWVLPLP